MSAKTKTVTFEEILDRDGILVYTNKGVSMRPLLKQGRDLMVIKKKDPKKRCANYDVVLFKRDNGQYVLHRILKVLDGTYWIVGDNCTSGEIIREDQILGILTEVLRKGKRISVRSTGFLIYTHIWCDVYPVRFFLLSRLRDLRRVKNAVRRIGKKLLRHNS